MGVVFRAYPVRGESHIHATPTEMLQQHALLFTTNRTDHTFFFVEVATSWSLHHFVAMGKPERQVRKASPVAASNNRDHASQ